MSQISNLSFNFSEFHTKAQNFLIHLETKLLELQLLTEQSPLYCDHVCFRVSTLEEYEFYKQSLSQHSVLLTEALVNGRPIATYKLNKALMTSRNQVELIELPAPKPGSTYKTGFEHAEFVTSEHFDLITAQHPHLSFKVGGQKTINPELCLKLDEQTQIKFHHTPLDRVIEIEEARPQHLFFDLDGTLVDSREIIYKVNQAVFSKACEREVSIEEVKAHFYPEFPKLFEVFNVTDPLKKQQAVQQWGEDSLNYTYPLFKGVKKSLELLKNAGFILHLWTARDELSGLKILNDHQLTSYFTTLSFSDGTSSKPLASNLNFNYQSQHKNSLVMLGDSSTDMKGAHNISAIKAAALWCEGACSKKLIKNGAELHFETLEEFTVWALATLKVK